MTNGIHWIRIIVVVTILLSACWPGRFAPLTVGPEARNQPTPRRAVTPQGAWRLTETAIRSPGASWETRPAPQGGLYVFTTRHYSYFYVPGAERRPPFASANQPTDAERAAAYSNFIAGAGSYTFDGATLALKADFRKNPNEMNGDVLRVQAEFRDDTLQLVFVNPPFLPGREYRVLLLRVE